MALQRAGSLTWEAIQRNQQRTKEEELLEKERKLQAHNNFLVPDIPDRSLKDTNTIDVIESSLEKTSRMPLESLGNKITLTQLKNDDEFAATAERFMESINRDENIYEYLRDANFSLSSAAQRAAEMKRWDEQTLQDYSYLRNRFNNAEIGNWKERVGLIKDLGGDILLDPLNWLTALLALPSAGSSLGFGLSARAVSQAAINKGIKELAKQGTKRWTKEQAEKSVKYEAARRFARVGAVEGAAWTGLHDYFMQDIDINLGLQDDIEADRIAKSMLMGGAFGGAIGGVAGRYLAGPGYSKTLQKEFDFAAEGNVDVFVGQLGEKPFYKIGSEQPKPKQKQLTLFDDVEQPKQTKETKPNPRKEEAARHETESRADATVHNKLDDEDSTNFLDWKEASDKIGEIGSKAIHPLTWFLRTFVQKPTEKFVDVLKDNASPTLVNNLRKLRNDFDRGIARGLDSAGGSAKLRKEYADEMNPDGPKSQLTTQSYGEYFGELIGKYHIGLEQTFGVLGLTGWRQVITKETNNKMKTLLQSKDIQVLRQRELLTDPRDPNPRYGRYTGEEHILVNMGSKKGKANWQKVEIGYNHNGIELDKKMYFGYTRLRGLYDDVYDRAKMEGLFKQGGPQRLGYFPRKFNHSSIQKNRVGLEREIVKANHANPNNEIETFKDFVQKVGDEWVDVGEAAHKASKGRDWNLFVNLKETGSNSFEELAARKWFWDTLSKGQRKRISNSKEVKAWLNKNDYKGKDAWKESWRYLVDKIDDKMDINQSINGVKTRISFGKESPYNYLTKKTNETVDLYEYARRLKARHIVDDMLNKRHVPYELQALNKRYGESSGFLHTRVFSRIPDSALDEFIDTDVMRVSQDYFNNASQILARSRYFGNNIDDLKKDIFEPIRRELESSGMSADEASKVTGDFMKMISKVTGVDQSHRNSWFARTQAGRTTGDILKLSQQMAHLPLATLSSITEPLILLTRDFSTDTAATIGKSLINEGGNIISRTVRQIKMGSGQVLQGKRSLKHLGIEEDAGKYKISQVSDDDWFELYKTGLALEQTVMERIEGLAGEALHGSKMKSAQNFFFKSNLLTQWTRAVQLASYTTGKRIIRQHARALATGKTDLGNKLSSGRRKLINEELRDLGIEPKEAATWWNNSLNKATGQFDENLSKGITGKFEIGEGKIFLQNAQFYQKMNRGGNRFAKEIILNPSVQEANRPLWFSNPNAQLLMQFAGYPTVFTNTILKKFARDLAKDGSRKEMYRTGKILPTVFLMTAVAHVGNEIRSNGKAKIDYATGEEKSTPVVIKDAWRRWGGLGPLDYVARFDDQRERGMGLPTELLKSIGGPLPQDVIDMIAYRKGFAEVGVSNAPYFQLYDMFFGEGTKAKLRKYARGSKAKTPKRNKDRYGFDKGGLVYNVPNVVKEPDERIDKLTGKRYNNNIVFLEDEEDRALKGQMAGLGLREPFVVGGLVQSLGKTVTKGVSRKSAINLRNRYLDPDFLKTLKPKKLAAKESYFNVRADQVHELLTDGLITIKEARTLLKDYGYKTNTIKKIMRGFKDVDLKLGDDFVSWSDDL